MENGNRLDNVVVCITCELGRAVMSLKDIRQLKDQDILELDKLAGESFEVRMNGKLFGYGEVVVVTDLMSVRLTGLVDVPQEVGS